MIRKNPAYDTVNPAGQVHFELPLAKAIEEYKEDTEYFKGYNDGYIEGYSTCLNDIKKEIQQHLDPNSELGR